MSPGRCEGREYTPNRQRCKRWRTAARARCVSTRNGHNRLILLIQFDALKGKHEELPTSAALDTPPAGAYVSRPL